MRRLISQIGSRTQGSQQGRKKVRQSARNKKLRVLAAASLLVAAGVAGWFGWRSDGAAVLQADLARQVDLFVQDSGLSVGSVLVTGRVHTDVDALMNALDIERGSAILGFDPEAARKRVISLGWVKQAVVSRRLPDTINVQLVEHTPFALWQRERVLVLIDRSGQEITRRGLEYFAHLPLVVGNGAAIEAEQLIAMLSSDPDLSARISAAVRVGDRRWNLRFENGIDVQLPENEPELAWQRLGALEREYRLLARDITTVDMRLPDRLFVRPVKDGLGGTRNMVEFRMSPGDAI